MTLSPTLRVESKKHRLPKTFNNERETPDAIDDTVTDLVAVLAVPDAGTTHRRRGVDRRRVDRRTTLAIWTAAIRSVPTLKSQLSRETGKTHLRFSFASLGDDVVARRQLCHQEREFARDVYADELLLGDTGRAMAE